MAAFSKEIKLEKLFRNHQNRNSILKLGLFPQDLVAIFGFACFILSCYLTFTPISEGRWIQGSMGIVPLLFAFIAIVALYKKNYFAAFFIAMFNAFFLTHAVIIAYDLKAVQMGRELGTDGWFRPVLMIFSDALQVSYGAFWGIVGSVLAVLTIIVAWIYENHQFNVFISEHATNDSFAFDSFFENEDQNTTDEGYVTSVDTFYSENKDYSNSSTNKKEATDAHDGLASEAAVSRVVISPAGNTSVERGHELKFTAEAHDDAGCLLSSDSADFVWINADKNGVFVRTTPGNYAVSAEYRGKQSDRTVVDVE